MSNKPKISQKERAYLKHIQERVTQLHTYLATTHLDESADLVNWYDYIAKIRAIQGNINNDISFIASLMAKHYLASRFNIGDFDVAVKPQGAPGLDIDLQTTESWRVIGEIKTTVPYSGAKNDLGAQQKHSFEQDFEKLNRTAAEYKFFFVTDPKTFQVVRQRYTARIPGVEIILLP